MARVTYDEVIEIMDNCTLSSTVVETYINAANLFLNSLFNITDADESSESSGAVETTDLYKEMERWLTAHMISSTRFRMSKSEQVGDAKVEYVGKFGMGLDSTPYGQMLKMMDPTGELASADKRKASIFAIPQFDD